MDEASVQQRLSQIATVWTLVMQAHGEALSSGEKALAALLERYQGAVYRYLLGAVRDPDTADELFQEFALRFVRGDFRRADASRGRFRDYVKTALIHLVINHKRKQASRPAAAEQLAEVADAAEPSDPDAEFLAGWRKALLDRAWAALAAQPRPGAPPFHAVLRLRTEQPELSSQELLERLNTQLAPTPPLTSAGMRKILQRAREQFTDLLVEEVARSLGAPSPDELEQEIIDLGFQAYCRRALERRRGPRA